MVQRRTFHVDIKRYKRSHFNLNNQIKVCDAGSTALIEVIRTKCNGRGIVRQWEGSLQWRGLIVLKASNLYSLAMNGMIPHAYSRTL